jgi:hypothetical protein
MITSSRFGGRKRDQIGESGHIDMDTRGGIGENRFIEDDITRDVNTTRGAIKTFIPLMHRTIPKEGAHSGTKRELMCIILAQTGPTCTTKYAKKGVVWLDLEKAMNGRVLL